jgi:hypothetical protein
MVKGRFMLRLAQRVASVMTWRPARWSAQLIGYLLTEHANRLVLTTRRLARVSAGVDATRVRVNCRPARP